MTSSIKKVAIIGTGVIGTGWIIRTLAHNKIVNAYDKNSKVEKKIKIIEITEKIPNDPFVFRKNLPSNIEAKFISALKKFLSTEKGKLAFKNIYSVTGVVDADDSDYDNLREIIKTVDIDINQFIN